MKPGGGQRRSCLSSRVISFPLALLLGPQVRQVALKGRLGAERAVTVARAGQQPDQAGVRPFARFAAKLSGLAQVDGQGIGRAVLRDQAGQPEPLLLARDAARRLPRRADITLVEQNVNQDVPAGPAACPQQAERHFLVSGQSAASPAASLSLRNPARSQAAAK